MKRPCGISQKGELFLPRNVDTIAMSYSYLIIFISGLQTNAVNTTTYHT